MEVNQPLPSTDMMPSGPEDLNGLNDLNAGLLLKHCKKNFLF